MYHLGRLESHGFCTQNAGFNQTSSKYRVFNGFKATIWDYMNMEYYIRISDLFIIQNRGGIKPNIMWAWDRMWDPILMGDQVRPVSGPNQIPGKHAGVCGKNGPPMFHQLRCFPGFFPWISPQFSPIFYIISSNFTMRFFGKFPGSAQPKQADFSLRQVADGH